jgi:hypothetical protein
MLVRVSRRRSVTIFPFVVTVDSVNTRDTLPLSFVVTEDSAIFEVMSFGFGLSAAAWTQNAAATKSPPNAAIIAFLSFMALFLSLVFL